MKKTRTRNCPVSYQKSFHATAQAYRRSGLKYFSVLFYEIYAQIVERVCRTCKEVDLNAETVFSVYQSLHHFLETFLSTHAINLPAPPVQTLGEVLSICTNDKRRKTSSELLFCSDCNNRAAKVNCIPCKDAFCEWCFRDAHMTGERKHHKIRRLAQSVCSGCEKTLAVHIFNDGTQQFCHRCYSEAPSALELNSHRLGSGGLECFGCRLDRATVLCNECTDAFCQRCWYIAHYRGALADHRFLIIPGSTADPEQFIDSVELDLLLGRVLERRYRSGSGSLPFLDSNLCTYWRAINVSNRVSDRA